MRNFHKIAEGVEVLPLLHSIQRQSHLWNANRFRTTFPNTPHVDVDDIMLRFSDTEKCQTTTNVIGDDYPVFQPAWKLLPEVQPIILNLMRWTKAYELGRVLITRLPPGGRILPHADKDGSYVQADDRARYHVVLQGLPGSLYTTGDETVQMLTGEIWWFNAYEVHHIENNSIDDRIHLLVDVRTM
jgi:hypothetical protein